MKLWTEEEQEKYLKEFAPAVAVAPAEPLPVTEPKSATFMERADYGVSIGAPIIPLNPRLKTPWHGLGVNSKTTDWELIAKWNRQEPTLNCGIVAVHELGGKWFLDDDLGTLEETIQNETGHSLAGFYRVRASRGPHYYFEHDEGSLKMAFDGSFNSSVISVPGWKGEARTDNQYVLSAKSIHPSGHVYDVEHCALIVPAPQWLLDWIQSKYVLSQKLNPAKTTKQLKSSIPYGVTRTAEGALIIGKNPPDAGFRKLFDVVGYDPLVRRLNKHADPRYHDFSLGDGEANTFCPIPTHCKPEEWDVDMPYTPCFGVIAGAPHLVHCFGCGWSGDMVAACNKVDGGTKTMYQTARDICAEGGLAFEDFFPKAEQSTTPYMTEQKMAEPTTETIIPRIALISSHMRGGGVDLPLPLTVQDIGEPVEANRNALVLAPSALTSTRLGDIYSEIFEPHGFPLEMALPALVTAASVRVPNGTGSGLIVGDDVMTNLYTALIGSVNCGKSQVIQWACCALNIYKPDFAPRYMEAKFPSTERMLLYLKKNLKNFKENFLINPDEWSYLFQKNRVTGSSFPQFMTTSYYRRRQTFPLAGRAGELVLNNAISYIGGVVDAEFDCLFDASTLGGLYDRFLFGMKEGWKFDFRP
ncbi:MAG TPA: bifunctional DNA primase/polymerase, partial [Candidatus Acidoferrales bacterium]